MLKNGIRWTHDSSQRIPLLLTILFFTSLYLGFVL
jgi:hypothetical protein